MKQKFNVTGMTCSACSAHVEKAVCKLAGTEQVTVNLLQNTMTVEYREGALAPEDIVSAVEHAGYGASVQSEGKQQAQETARTTGVEGELKEMKVRLWVSFVFLALLMYISMGHMMGLPLPDFLSGLQNAVTYGMAQFLLTLPIMYVNRKYYQKGFKTLFHGAPNMDSLIAIGSGAAVVYGVYAIIQMGRGLGLGDMALVEQYHMDLYFESAGTILALITLGKFLETRSKGKTSDAISKLLDLAPKTAVVLRDGQEVEVLVEEVVVGDVLIVKPGQSVPVDGTIVEGSAALDESAITGESLPVEKKAGDRVIGATVNRSGWFKMEAVKVGSDTTLAQIIQLVEDANGSKAPIAKLADKVSAVFVPVVITIAVAASIIWLLLGHSVSFALSIGIAVLVISCPCALGLATPTAIMVGTGKGAEHGILIKSAESLEIAHTIQTVVLDKTGTVTEGKPTVTDIVCAPQVQQEQLLQAAASVENQSEHPLAQAIVHHAGEQSVSLLPAQEFTLVEGRGVTGKVDGKRIIAGNAKMMEEHKVDISTLAGRAEQLAQQGKTPLYFASDGALLGMIVVADVVKPTSRQAIGEFAAMGIDVVMLTGDNQKTAQAIGKQLGIPKVIAEVLPQDKERQVSALQAEGKKVAMVGDGINDAPALARADVGIAIGAGTDVAIESADIVLMKSDLLDAVAAVQLSKATIRNIKQNLFWAFFYNAIGIPLAAGVFYSMLGWKLSPMFGAAAMSLSSVCVVSNALRLKLFRPKFHREIQDVPDSNTTTIQTEGGSNMTKTMKIEGMSCGHCSARVEQALNAIDGVTATVNLEVKTADVQLSKDVPDDVLTNAVTEAGYQVVSIH